MSDTTSTRKPPKAKLAPSPYATGGGGTVLEHQYCATVLASLLLGEPITGLGNDAAITRVAFQASTESPVDDLLVTGTVQGQSGPVERRLSVGVRRDPTIGPSDLKFVKLLGDCAQTYVKHTADFDSDLHRLLLVVVAPHTGAQEIGELTELARRFRNQQDFHTSIGTPGYVHEKIRRRLTLFVEALTAAQTADSSIASLDADELSWRLLRSLWMHQCRLEADSSDRTACIQRLCAIVETPAAAEALFERLYSVMGGLAKAGGTVDQTFLRRELAGHVRLVRGQAFATAWRVLDSLRDSLRNRTPRTLRPSLALGGDLHIDRDEARKALVAAIRQAATSKEALLVTGEPGVGKSVLALEAIDEVVQGGAAATMFSLRDLEGGVTVQLEQMLGARLADVLGATQVSELRLLLLDGAEVVQEGQEALVRDLVQAACQAGLTVVAVTRKDAEKNVTAVLKDGWRLPGVAGSGDIIAIHKVDGFAEPEVEALVKALPSVQRFAEQPHARWLLRRPGLLKLVIEGSTVECLPSGPLCEAVVYAVVWKEFIRRGERMKSDGATPDGREAVLAALSSKLLLPSRNAANAGYPDPHALPSLRADGILLPVQQGRLWHTGDQFASDLLRDIAVTQLLVKESPQLLIEANLPRWTLNAARVALQSFLLDNQATDWQLPGQLAFCRDLANRDGERWAELPWEAVLTVPGATSILEQVWAGLAANDRAGLRNLLRVLKVRFGDSLRTDPVAGAAVVSLLCNHWGEAVSEDRELRGECQGVVRRWLSGLALIGRADTSDRLRIRVRDELLLSEADGRTSDWQLACLSLLGPDLDATAETRLRAVAADNPDDLHACVEDWVAPYSLGAHRPQLLLELAEAYYIEPPDETDTPPWVSSHASMDYGVRRHRGYSGLRAPLASWHYGPFLALLRSSKAGEAISFIKRMIDHATQIRVQVLERPSSIRLEDRAGAEDGMDVVLAGGERRRFLGDSNVWLWYRGMGVGPFPCISALMALEVVVDEWIAAGMPVDRIAALLLKDTTSLAIAGFVYGLFVRHIDQAEQLIVPWLAVPAVWRLDSHRTLEERSQFQWARSGKVKNPERRTLDPMTVAAALALGTGYGANREQLIAAGTELVAAAQRTALSPQSEGGVDESEAVLVARRWAAMLNVDNYQPSEQNGQRGMKFTEPPEIEEAFRKLRAPLVLVQFSYRIASRYGWRVAREEFTANEVLSDLQQAQALIENPPSAEVPHNFWDGIAALAAVALGLHATRALVLSPDQLALALGALVSASVEGHSRGRIEDTSYFSIGSDRAAARALPLVLLPDFDLSALNEQKRQEVRDTVRDVLRRIALGPVIETRTVLVDALQGVWDAPCDHPGAAPCHHRVGFDTLAEAARWCRFGPWDAKGRRELVPLAVPLAQTLHSVAANDLLPSRLEFVIGGLAAIAVSDCCASEDAYNLLIPLMDAYGKVATEVDGPDQIVEEHAREVLACNLLRLAGRRSPELLLRFFECLLVHHGAAAQMLDEFCRAATYDAEARAVLGRLWPDLMDQLLETWERTPRRESRQYASDARIIASMIPQPKTRRGEDAIDARLDAASQSWITASSIDSLMGRWLAIAAGIPECADALVFFLHRRPLDERVRFGLPWLERVIDGKYDQIAQRTWCVVEWIDQTFKLVGLSTEARDRFRRLIDGLASRNDAKALDLQRRLDRELERSGSVRPV